MSTSQQHKIHMNRRRGGAGPKQDDLENVGLNSSGTIAEGNGAALLDSAMPQSAGDRKIHARSLSSFTDISDSLDQEKRNPSGSTTAIPKSIKEGAVSGPTYKEPNKRLLKKAGLIARSLERRCLEAQEQYTTRESNIGRIEQELDERTRGVEEQVKKLRDLQSEQLQLARTLEQTASRAQSEYAVKLEKIDAFTKELDKIDEFESRVKRATGRMNDCRSRLNALRQNIENEKQRQDAYERRTTANRSIFWSCLACGGAIAVAAYAFTLFRRV
ncbi:uncharacterized protein V1516DRAFT_661750 [Lipomyces oligophaga]|uniref:uncharacterized protein n=1 Tax=Lipomyces oligophaga TaxID=45792 RepID=UPI0034CDEF06